MLFVLNRPIRAQRLPLRSFAWTGLGSVYDSVDLDEDGREELLVVKKDGRWWWVKLGEHTQYSLPIPVPKGASCLRSTESIAVFGKGNRLWVIARSKSGW